MADTPQRYYLRPAEVVALQLTKDNKAAVEEFVHGKVEERLLPGPGRGMHDAVVIRTLDQEVRTSWGEWIIRADMGIYACPAEHFESTYVVADPSN